MAISFYMTALLAIIAVGLALTSRHAVHGLLYLLLGLMALSMNLYVLGNELGAILLVVVYAGAIMVLFVFVVMLLNLASLGGGHASSKSFMRKFFGPTVLATAIFAQLIFVLFSHESSNFTPTVFAAKDIAAALFQDGWVFVELLSLLLTAALIGAFHIGRRRHP